ncbi:MAG: hypothetical protein JWN15_2821 [Firmicutes bacterium]|nr:hypothetical protein [Bacillota bacterium]
MSGRLPRPGIQCPSPRNLGQNCCVPSKLHTLRFYRESVNLVLQPRASIPSRLILTSRRFHDAGRRGLLYVRSEETTPDHIRHRLDHRAGGGDRTDEARARQVAYRQLFGQRLFRAYESLVAWHRSEVRNHRFADQR